MKTIISKICQRYIRDTQINQRYAEDMPKQHQRYAEYMPKIGQRYAKDMPKIWKDM